MRLLVRLLLLLPCCCFSSFVDAVFFVVPFDLLLFSTEDEDECTDDDEEGEALRLVFSVVSASVLASHSEIWSLRDTIALCNCRFSSSRSS